MKLKLIVMGLVAFGFGSAVTAQTTAPQRIEITGSSIKRIQAEGALPVQTISRTEIERAGIVSAEQLVATITANGTGADNLSSNVGIQLGTTDRNNNGNSSANLRGLGSNSTLVLLNGRRVSTHGAKGNSVDLNSIPLAAVERVEVLKDGASAIYGTDAIGGVINFILRKDYSGLEARVFADVTQAGGGDVYRGSVLGGFGSLDSDGYNFMASLTHDQQKKLGGYGARSFSNGYQPERGLSPDTTGTPFATQTSSAGTAISAPYTLPTTGTQTYNRANLLSFQGKCDSVPFMSQYQAKLWGNAGFANGCAFDYGGSEVLIQPVERTNLVARARFALGPQHTLVAEVTGSRSKASKDFEPYQITTTGALAGAQYPVNGPYYQDLSAFIPTFDKTKKIAYRWRCTLCGNRTIQTTSEAYRFLLGAEGSFLDNWDYKVGISSAGSKATSLLGPGYYKTAGLVAALGSGKINPWLLPGQTQDPDGVALLQAASAAGTKLFGGKAGLTQFDGTVSGEVFQLPAGPASIAVGFDVRQETYQFSDGSVSAEPTNGAPFDPEFPKVKRDINAVFAELAIPVVKGLEASLAVRTDHYSDFGNTTNPKVSLRWNPVEQLLVRASANTGFRAPSFFQVYGETSEAQIPGNIADPVLCPKGNVPGADLSVCAIRPNARQGGNKELKPETSKQWTAGIVVSPVDWASFSIDWWNIDRKDLIYELTPQQVVANFTTFPNNFQRGADGRLDSLGGYIRAGFVNADGDITTGVDLNAKFNGALAGGKWNVNLDGTYIQSHKSRVFATDDYVESVGKWDSRNLFVRWKHQASVTYSMGDWSSTLRQSYTAGYEDEVPQGTVPPGFDPKVKSYTLYGVSASYTGIKGLTLTGGIKNLFNTKPPFTAHNLDFAAGAGWDPRVGDPRLRAFTLSANYKFF
jgi:iron complex outermembrane recepter protein